jgi:transketolase
MNETKQSLLKARKDCAIRLINLYKNANAGHIGSSFSCLEILVDLCFNRMNPNDIIILSKGHAAGALYTTLSLSGRMPEAELDTFYKDDTLLAAHPPCSRKIKSIPFGTGSLGHGLSLASGLAFSQTYTGANFNVFCILSDGDCNEGATWEAALFAAQRNLKNLNIIIDLNGIQGIGYTKDIINLEPIMDKWKSFGFKVSVADDGNDFESLENAFNQCRSDKEPKCIIARTKKGHGIEFMENRVEWHYLPMNQSEYNQAINEILNYK